MMTVGSLFSGAGGFDLGLEQAGFTIVWQVEKDKACRRILKRRFLGHPKPKVFDDVCRITNTQSQGGGAEIRSGLDLTCDLLVGGWPCQDLSVAGKRKGLAGERSGLFFEVLRIAKETQPAWGLFENVPGLLSSHGGRDMATVLEGLRQCWPVVGYRVLDSQYFGVAQRRKRVFFVCGPTERGVEEILFEPEGGEGHLATSEKARPELAASLRGRSSRHGINPPGRGGEDDMNLVCAPVTGNGCYGDQIGNESHLVNAITNLGSGGPDDNEAQAGHLVAETMRSGGNQTGGHRPPGTDVDTASTYLRATAQGARRLTPTECERLQGFPDGWTCLCQPLEAYDHMKCQCADGPRYRMVGNAVTVNVIKWLGMRIARVEKGTT